MNIRNLFFKKLQTSDPIPIIIRGGDVKVNATIPTCWNHITVGQYIKLKKWDQQDSIELLAILTGVEREVIDNCRQLDLDMKLAPLMEWMSTAPVLPKSPPLGINYDGQYYLRPTNIGLKSYGQKVLLQEAMRKAYEEHKSFDTIIAYALAIYFCESITGKSFGSLKKEGLFEPIVAKMEALPLMEAYPVADFFIRRYVAWLTAKVVSRRTAHQRRNKREPTASTASG